MTTDRKQSLPTCPHCRSERTMHATTDGKGFACWDCDHVWRSEDTLKRGMKLPPAPTFDCPDSTCDWHGSHLDYMAHKGWHETVAQRAVHVPSEEVLGDSRPWTPGPWEFDGFGGVRWPDAPKRPKRVQNPVTNKMEDVKYKDEPRTYGYGCGNDFVACLNDGEYHEYTNPAEQRANAKLIALAPEMAEAILGADGSGGLDCLEQIAAKLRMIGGSDV